MYRKLLVLFLFVVVLSLAGNVHAHTYWTGAAGDHNWFTPENWDTGLIPTVATGEARIRDMVEGEPPIIIAAEGAVSGGSLRLGYGTGMRGELTVEAGGVLQTGSFVIGQSNLSVGVFTLNGGTHNMTGGFNCANNNSAQATINIKSGSIIKTGGGTSYMPQFGPLTINITGGTVSMPDNDWRIGHPNGRGALDMHLDGGVLEIKRLFLGRQDDIHTIDITDGVLILTGDDTVEMQGLMDAGMLFTSYNGRLFMDYDVTNAGKTTVWAAAHLLDPSPRDGAVVSLTLDQLGWTLPDPNSPGGIITCDVYFGTDPNHPANPMIVDHEDGVVDSVSITVDPLTDYYWSVDVYDSSISATEPFHRSLVFTFNTQNQPPIVDAGGDVETWLAGGPRVWPLDGSATDDDMLEPVTFLWTVTAEPNDLNPAQISDLNAPDATLTMKEAGTYTLQFDAYDGEFTVTKTKEIELYADSCEHARNQPGFVRFAGDIHYDCRVDLLDLAVMVADWLQENYTTE